MIKDENKRIWTEKDIEDELTNAMLNRLRELGFKNPSDFKTVDEVYDSCDDEYELITMDGNVKIKVFIGGIDEIDIQTFILIDNVWKGTFL